MCRQHKLGWEEEAHLTHTHLCAAFGLAEDGELAGRFLSGHGHGCWVCVLQPADKGAVAHRGKLAGSTFRAAAAASGGGLPAGGSAAAKRVDLLDRHSDAIAVGGQRPGWLAAVGLCSHLFWLAPQRQGIFS